MANLSDRCIDKLCHLASGLAAAGGALAPGAGPIALTAGSAQALLGGAGLAMIWGSKKGQAESVLKNVRADVAKDYRQWIEAERVRNPWPASADLDAAIAAFDRILPKVIPTPEEVVGSKLDGAALADLLLAKAAALDHNFRTDGQNPAGPRVFRAIVIGAWNVLRDNSQYYDRLRPCVDQAVLSGLAEVHPKLDELLSIARAGGSFQRAAEGGISEAAVRTIVERLGGEGVGPDELISWLQSWIEGAERQLDKHTNEDAAFEAAVKEATRRFNAGRLDEASSPFMDEFACEQGEEAERQEKRKRRRLRLLEEAVRFDELAFNGQSAAQKLRLMAEVEGVSGGDALGKWLSRKAGDYFERGDRQGDNGALVVAIATEREALEQLPRKRVPLDWAWIQNNLGHALAKLGDRESGTERLKEAVIAYRLALEERTRERVPIKWASTQNGLGNALLALGVRESGTQRLEEAVVAYRAALAEWTRDRAPLDWAVAQSNLGIALAELGGRESGTELLEESVAAHRAALEERPRESVPFDWASSQNNLGSVLHELGERESGTERLKEAVAACRAALEVWTRERAPLDWARAQHNLGNALQVLGLREGCTEWLEEAVSVHRAALEEWTRDRVPLKWASLQNNVGIGLALLGGGERLEEAVAAFRLALEEWTRERVPLDWARTQNNLGNALASIGLDECGSGRLEEAVIAHSAALEEWTRERMPLDWAVAQKNLARDLALIGERSGDRVRLQAALDIIDGPLEVFRVAEVGVHLKDAEWLRAQILAMLGIRKAGSGMPKVARSRRK